MVEARAPRSVEAEAIRTEAGRASALPLVQMISSEDSSRGKEAAEAEAASTVERPVPTPAEGSSVLVRVRPEPRGWDSPRVVWGNQADPEGEPVFALEDVAEGGTRTPSSNTANWRCSRCRQRCLLCKGTYPVLPRYALPFLVSRCFFSEPPLRCLTYAFACFRSSRPGPLGNRCSYEGRGASGSSSGGKRACLPTPRSSCRGGVLKWRTSAFAVST